MNMKKEEKSLVKTMINDYISKDVVTDFSTLTREVKLSILQKTPPKFIKERVVGNKLVRYVEHTYSRKALNFVFNFEYSCEIVKKEYIEYEEAYSQKQKDGTFKRANRKVIEAECEVLFTFPNGLKRTVISSHKGYPNPATTRADIMKAALSKAYTRVAQTFGVATEEEYIPTNQDPEETEQTSTVEEMNSEYPLSPAKKSFINQNSNGTTREQNLPY